MNKFYANSYYILLLVCFVTIANISFGQLNLTNVAPSATIDFSNSMQTTVGSNPSTAFTAAGFSPAPTTAGRLNSNAWSFTGWSDGNLAFGGVQTTANTDFTRGIVTGAVPSMGGIYSYTGSEVIGTSAANPILLIQPIGSDFTPGTIVLKIHNNDPTLLINKLTIAYKIYVRNDQNRSQSLNFSYSPDNVTYTALSAFDYATPTSLDASGLVLGATRNPVITGINIPAGMDFYIRWTSDDISGSGVRDEIGLDDISVGGTYVAGCTPPTIQASLNAINNLLPTQMDLDVARGNGSGGVLVVATQGTTLGTVALVGSPVSGVTYHANSNYGTGAVIGNGFVVYDGTAAVPFVVTGLTPNTFYSFYFFEYNISVPCYNTSISEEDQQTPLIGPSIPVTSTTDLFRSAANGNWADARTWVHSTDGGLTFNPAELSPTSASAGITIMGPHTVDITCPASMDQTSIAGLLTLSPDGVINLNNGLGYDIDIISGGTFRTQTNINYSSTFVYTGGPQINVSTGGKITLGNGGSAPGYSALGYTPGLVNWNTDAVLEWNSTDPFITAGNITYFPDAASGTIPIFRVSKSPSLQPGATANTGWNGVMEVNANLTLKLAGIKTFRNGITGTGNLYQDDNCGQFLINGATAKLGNIGLPAGSLNLNSGNDNVTPFNDLIAPGCITTLISDKVINQTGGAGSAKVSGTLLCGTNIITGTSIFNLATGGTIGLGSPGGISSAGSTGNIQVSGTRIFDAGGNYIYNGSANQVTGSGLPATVNTLTIANTGAVSNNTVTNSRAGTTLINSGTAGSFGLGSGLFIVGSGNNISIANNGGIAAVTGDFAATSSGSVTFVGTGLVSGTVNFYPDVFQTPAGSFGVNYGSSSILHGLLQLNSSSFVNINAPTYLLGSLLKYNSGGTYNRNVEWSTASGNGFPYDVQVSNSTVLSPARNGGFASVPFHTAGNLTIDNASAIYMDEASTYNMLLPLVVGGNLLINGALSGSQAIGGDIVVAGNWARNSTGSFFPNDRAVFFNGSINSTITANNGETFDYLYFSKNAVGNTVFLADNISVSKEFGMNTGTLDLQAKNVTLLSSATATARFANFGAGTPANAAINYSGAGRFVVNRYIPSGVSHPKSWQFLATPTNGGQTVKAAWQEGATVANQNLSPGYGTQLTSNVAGAATFPTPGFDVLTPAGPSVKTYDPLTGLWVGIANTTIPVYNQKGYMVFVRGDRSVSFGGTAVATIMRTTGKIFEPVSNIPPVTNVGANQFESIGNPYASSIDFSNDAAVIKSANVQKVFYVWDPKLTTIGVNSVYGLGGFQTFTKGIGTDYTVTPGGGSYGASGSVNNIIQSGQAFFVHTVGGTGTVSFTEAAKVSGSSITFKPVNIVVSDKQLRNNLYVISGGEPILIDGVLNQFDATYSNKTDELDALKFSNSGENMGILRNNQMLVVERRAMIERTDTIFYNLGQMKVNQYQFEFSPDNLSIAGLAAFLEDNYLRTSTVISLSDTTRILFNINNEAGSYAANRFRLVFVQKNSPVKFTDIQAIAQGNDVVVDWQVTDESGISNYEVEKSADGINFSLIHTEAKTLSNAGFYKWIDTDPLAGANFYRIKSISSTTEPVYSKQVKVIMGKGNAGFVIFPNPVKDNTIGLQLKQLASGTYVLKLYNNNGQLLLSQNIDHAGGNNTLQLKVGALLAKGVYKVEITGPGGFQQSKTLLAE